MTIELAWVKTLHTFISAALLSGWQTTWRNHPPTAAFVHPPLWLSDAVLLFAVLTCIPHDEDQRVLIDELVRVLKPGGILYISDLGLQGDERNRDRYDIFQQKYGVYGVFETGDGAVCRHHTMEWLRSLVSSCELLATEEVEVVTMNGHHSQAVQLLARKSPAEGR
jgi:hypothetical protein